MSSDKNAKPTAPTEKPKTLSASCSLVLRHTASHIAHRTNIAIEQASQQAAEAEQPGRSWGLGISPQPTTKGLFNDEVRMNIPPAWGHCLSSQAPVVPFVGSSAQEMELCCVCQQPERVSKGSVPCWAN